MASKKNIVFKLFSLALWVSIGIGAVVLLVAAIRKKDAQLCRGVEIQIAGKGNFFIDKRDVLNVVGKYTNGNPVGKKISSLDLKTMEMQLEQNAWIKGAELYVDNNAKLRVLVTESEPVARIFAFNGDTFYLDTSLTRLPVSNNFSARLPVFTGFPSDKIILSAADSSLLRDISAMGISVQKDSFRMALIDQINITPGRSFEMVPKIGNQIIFFGDATDMESKWDKLELFYKEVMPTAGLNKYSVINLQYKGQIVAKRRDAEDVAANASRTLQLMQIMAENASRQASETEQSMLPDNEHNTADISIIQESIQRDDNSTSDEAFLEPATPLSDTARKRLLPKAVINVVPEKKKVQSKAAETNAKKINDNKKQNTTKTIVQPKPTKNMNVNKSP